MFPTVPANFMNNVMTHGAEHLSSFIRGECLKQSKFECLVFKSSLFKIESTRLQSADNYRPRKFANVRKHSQSTKGTGEKIFLQAFVNVLYASANVNGPQVLL